METIRGCLKNNNTCVIALMMFDENNIVKPKKVHRVLSCIIHYLLKNYVCIGYLSCQSKTLSIISSYRIFEQTSFNTLLGIGIPELSLNLVSCHGFTEEPNVIVILNCWSCLANNYLARGLFIIEKDSKQLNIILIDMKLRIHAIYQLEIDFVMAKNTAIHSVANTIKKLHIQSYFHLIYQQDFYKDN